MSDSTLVTPWVIACQGSLSMEFSRQEYWSGLPFPSPGDLPDPGIEVGSPVFQADSLPSEPSGKLHLASTADIYCLTCLEARSPRSRCWQGWFLLRAGREGSTLGLSPWPVDGHFLLVYLHIIFSVGMSASGSKFPSFRDTSHIELESILNNSF